MVAWFYDLEKFCEDIEYMTGSQPHFYWKICWKFVSPALIVSLALISLLILFEFYFKTWTMLTSLRRQIVVGSVRYGTHPAP